MPKNVKGSERDAFCWTQISALCNGGMGEVRPDSTATEFRDQTNRSKGASQPRNRELLQENMCTGTLFAG